MLKNIAIIAIFLINQTHCIDESSPLYQEIEQYHNETNTKAEFAYQVVDKIFNAFQQWFFTITFCDFTYFENRILRYTETYGYGYPVMLLNGCPDTNNSKSKPKIDTHGQTAYLVTSDELTIDGSEQALMALASTGVFKPRSAVIFVINSPVSDDSYFYYAMKNHFQLLWSVSITNSVLVLWSGSLKMFTYNPFCDEIRDITHVKNVTKFLLHQYHNLYGYPLRLSVFRKPYISDDPEPVGCNSRLVMTVMKQLNATCKPLKPRDDSTVGDLLENGTATGVTKDLMDGYTDMELSSRILKTTYYGYIDTTYPLIQDELCFLTKKSIKQSTFTTTLKLISKNMLILFIFNVVFLIVISVVVYKMESKIWKENRPAEETILDVVRCLIRQTVDVKFIGPVFRCVSLMIMIYSLIVDCAIDGIITSAISYPRYKPDIDTLAKLLKTNVTFGVHNRDFLLFNKSLIPEYYEQFKDRVEIVNDDKIKQILDKRDFGYAILLRKTDADYIARKPSNIVRGRPIYHTVQDCPVPCSIVYGLKYGSPYLPRLNYLLHHLNQGGILQYWSLTDEFTPRNVKTKELTKDKKALSTDNLKEFFIVWIVGLATSTGIFFSEFIVYAARRNNQSPVEFLLEKYRKVVGKASSVLGKNKVAFKEKRSVLREKLKSLLRRKKKSELKENEPKLYEYCD
ncbi:uncharacterized protein LOC121733837 [Aricia agestis]|uniref:uncharacterized protein LOC121733837 n=1 Tax=Aricia agestis TaxID=91739 RepID=UPI001C208FF4|nr:uncharacterized protein LOC121733837 [Aricia agestis]